MIVECKSSMKMTIGQAAPSALILPLGRWGFIKTQTNKYNSFEIPSFLGKRAGFFGVLTFVCHRFHDEKKNKYFAILKITPSRH